MLEGLVQVYMPDLKTLNPETAKRYSAAPDYPEQAKEALQEMFRQRGAYRLSEDGILQSGVLIRHLILPGRTEESRDVIDYVAESFPRGSVLFSLMSQYTPMAPNARFPELSGTVSREENESLIHYMKVTEPGSVSSQAPNRLASLRREESSLPPLLVLSEADPFHWALLRCCFMNCVLDNL